LTRKEIKQVHPKNTSKQRTFFDDVFLNLYDFETLQFHKVMQKHL